MSTLERKIIEINASIEDTLRKDHSVEPRLGFEWEYQILDRDGNPVPAERIRSVLSDIPSVHRVYQERPFGLVETTTQPLPPSEAPSELAQIQCILQQWVQDQGHHLTVNSLVFREFNGRLHRSGSAALHVNSSLISTQRVRNAEESCLMADLYYGEVDARTANAVLGVLNVNRDTPLWTYQTSDDLQRLVVGDGTPQNYDVSCGKLGFEGISVRQCAYDVPYQTPPQENEPRADEHREATTPIYLEERFPGAATNPYVAALRTTLGLLSGLENPTYPDSQYVPTKELDRGAIPKTRSALASAHLGPASVFQKYLGRFYDTVTLEAIDVLAQSAGKDPRRTTKFCHPELIGRLLSDPAAPASPGRGSAGSRFGQVRPVID